jgi:hypothetical protein
MNLGTQYNIYVLRLSQKGKASLKNLWAALPVGYELHF